MTSDVDRYRELAIDLVRGERQHQLERWGEQSHSDLYWLAIHAEEHGEAAQAMLALDTSLLMQEVMQVTAVGLAWLEDLLRREMAGGEGS